MMGLLNCLFELGAKGKVELKTLLENGAMLLDVRTKEEYKQGAAADSINIPLDSLNNKILELKKDKPIIAICASGMRYGSAQY